MPVVTELDPKFVDLLEALEAASSKAGGAVCLNDQRDWYYPPLNGWSGKPTDIAGMHQAFDRTNLNDDYKEVVGRPTEGGTVGESMVTKLQIDYIAAMERAFRTRHASSVRCRINAVGRRKGHGHVNGLYTGSVMLHLQRLLSAAHDNPYA